MMPSFSPIHEMRRPSLGTSTGSSTTTDFVPPWVSRRGRRPSDSRGKESPSEPSPSIDRRFSASTRGTAPRGDTMRVAIVSHSYVLNGNRGKVHAVARLPGLDVLLIVPQKWTNRDIGQRLRAEPPGVRPLSVAALPAWPDSSGSLITYDPFALLRVLKRFRPDLVHVEEEPWSFAALELSLICHRLGVPFTFFTWENTDRRLFLPFSLIRRRVLRQARAAVAGNSEAKAILERHGFCNAVSVLPQLGVDTCTFSPPGGSAESRDTIVGYVGRLVPQKGLLLLLEAVPQLPANVRLMMVGNGPLKSELLGKARALGVEDRFELHDGVPHHDVPRHLARVSILVLPSLTTPTWKEQFGHILIE